MNHRAIAAQDTPGPRPPRPMRVALLLTMSVLLTGCGAQPNPVTPMASTSSTMEAVVTAILDERPLEIEGQPAQHQRLALQATSGPRTGETFEVEAGDLLSARTPAYAVGDRVLLAVDQIGPGQEAAYISDRVRREPLLGLFVLFAVAVVGIARWRGLASLGAMAISFAAIFLYLLPRISAGDDPIFVAITTAVVIVPVTYYLSHGVNRKTTAAVVGTLISLLATGLLAVFMVNAAVITGYASEEASYVQSLQPGVVNIRGLFLASVIIGLSGILDDITISQSAIVAQLRATAGHLGTHELYSRAMAVGRDHIASLVNTLVLVYASSAMPLLLLFNYSGAPWAEVINYEIVAEEIVRTLVASIGLVLAVPLSTALACMMVRPQDAAGAHVHDH